MKNFIQKGNVIDVTLGATQASGAALQVGDIVGVAMTAGGNGETIALAIEGVYELPKTAAQAVSQGQILYWDNTTKLVTTTASTNKVVGYAAKAALAADATVQVILARK